MCRRWLNFYANEIFVVEIAIPCQHRVQAAAFL